MRRRKMDVTTQEWAAESASRRRTAQLAAAMSWAVPDPMRNSSLPNLASDSSMSESTRADLIHRSHCSTDLVAAHATSLQRLPSLTAA
jgi:hypothetical protein